MSLNYRLQKWEADHDLLDRDFDKLVDWWVKNKHCDCDTEEYGMFCEHFDKIVNATLGKKVDQLWNERLQIGIQTWDEVMKN